MHMLITGGAGFIGSNLIRNLFEKYPDTQITCIDNFDPFYSADIKQLNIRPFKQNPQFHFIYLDLANTSVTELDEVIGEPVDVIIHIAAKAGVRPSINAPLAYQQTNVIGLQYLLEYAKMKNIRQFVFASSSSVYGLNDHFPWKESDHLLPVSPYAMTKQAGEMLGHVYSKLYGIRFIALRFFTVYGPGQRPDLAIHKFIKAMLKDQSIPVYGDGSTSRDYTYIDDITSGIISAITYDQSDFEIINLGNSETVSLNELINEIEKVTNKQAIIERLPEQPGDLKKTYADISKAKKLLNYSPSTKLPEGLVRFYQWFETHKEILCADEDTDSL